MKLNELVLYESIAENAVIKSCVALLTAETKSSVREHYFDLVKRLLATGKSLEACIITEIIETENIILEGLSHEEHQGTETEIACLRNDLRLLETLIKGPYEEKIKEADDSRHLLKGLLRMTEKEAPLMAYRNFFFDISEEPADVRYQRYIDLLKGYGTGEFAVNHAYYFDHQDQLVPVEGYNPLSWEHIYEYALQKERLQKNTEALITGGSYHHALLVGASGTGKSSSVKAVAHMYAHKKLRLIQLYKGQMKHLPGLLGRLAKSTFKFILFIDDLSFEVNEDDYKRLKSYIEGGIINEALNIAFYVTSNRQHLIKEIRSDREGDLHLQDSIQEMTSLSRRFGLQLTFSKPDQKEYFDMVARMLEASGIEYDVTTMEAEAKKWSMRHGGMSGRIADQFVREAMMQGVLLKKV